MTTKKLVIGYRIANQTTSLGYTHDRLILSLYPLRWHDFAKEMKGWLHHAPICESLRKRALECERATGSTAGLQYQNNDHDHLEVSWLGYRYSEDTEGEWIAGRIDRCCPDEGSLTILKLVAEAFKQRGTAIRPDELLELLEAKGATPVEYNQEADCYLPVKHFDRTLALQTNFVKA